MATFQHRTDSAVTPGKVDVDTLYLIGIQPEITAQLVIQVYGRNLPLIPDLGADLPRRLSTIDDARSWS